MATNYALSSNGGTITPDNSYYSTPATNLNDGSTDADWYSSVSSGISSGNPFYVKCTLSANRAVSQFDWVGASSWKISDYVFQYNNGSGVWTDCHTAVTGNTSTDFTHTFAAVVATEFRLKITAVANGYAAGREFRVWGDPVTTVSVTLAGSATSINSGSNVTITPTISDGYGTKTYLWEESINGGAYSTLPTSTSGALTFTAPSTGLHTIRFTVTDSSGSDTETISFFVGTISGKDILALSETSTYTTNVSSPTWSIVSGGGSINSSTGAYTAPSSGSGSVVIKATKSTDSTIFATKTINYPALTANFTISNTAPPIGSTITLTDTSIGTVTSRSWKLGSDTLGSGSTQTINTASLTVGQTYTVTLEVDNSSEEPSVATHTFTVQEVDFSPFEVLEHAKLANVSGLGWSAPLLEANFGGGYSAGIIANQSYGLHRWTISSEFLPDHSFTHTAQIDGESVTAAYFTYVFDFFKRHILRGNKPFIIKDFRTNLYYLVKFQMNGEIDFNAITAKFFTSEGIAVQEVRTNLDGFVFAENGSVTK